MFIKIKGDHIGHYNAVVTWFYKDNLEYLKEVIPKLYERKCYGSIPSEFHNITTIKGLKEFVKENFNDWEYPYGFKHIEGTFALYVCIG